MRGKEKCKALKEIRRQIAEKNDIEYAVSECTHQGECKGTCPKCEAELRYLERELEIRKGLGKAVAVVGISTSVCTGLTGCGPAQPIDEKISDFLDRIGGVEELAGTAPAPEVLDGDMQMPESTETPLPEDIAGGIAEAEFSVKEVMEGEVAELVTPLPEVLEGDVAMIETTFPEDVEGMLVIPIEGAGCEETEESLVGEIYMQEKERSK